MLPITPSISLVFEEHKDLKGETAGSRHNCQAQQKHATISISSVILLEGFFLGILYTMKKLPLDTRLTISLPLFSSLLLLNTYNTRQAPKVRAMNGIVTAK
jgi:hypothetical protein